MRAIIILPLAIAYFSVFSPGLPLVENSQVNRTTLEAGVKPPAMTGKVTFRVDTRNITVAPSGMFIAGSFLSTIGYTNWTFIPMCNLGSGIWEISFADIPAGLYQYKFVNGNAPAGWEFNGFGGPCTNPADNNNRWVTVTGGTQTEGPHCFSTCNAFCPGFADPGVSDVTPPTINGAVPPNTTITCGSALPPATALAASDGCDANVTTTTGPPTVNTSGLNACGTGTIVRTWSVTDCAGNTTSASQTITVVDDQDPLITAPIPGNVTVTCGNVPPPAPLSADDGCDASLVTTGLPFDNTAALSPCGTGNLLRTWTATDCNGNSTSATQTIAIIDNTPPVISGPVPPNVTVSCQNLPPALALPASDNCDASLTATGLPAINTTGIGPCGTGTLIRTWTATDCAGNSSSVSQTITLIDDTPPIINSPQPLVLTLDCNAPLPPGMPLPASDACDPGVSSTTLPTDNTSGLNSCGTGQIIRTWTATDCAGNTATVSQIINLTDLVPPLITGSVPGNTTLVCGSSLPPGLPLTAADACDQNVVLTALPNDNLNGLSPCGTGTISRTWVVTDCAGNAASATQLITLVDLTPPLITGNVPPDITVACGNLPPGIALPATDNCDPSVVSTGLPTDNTSGLNACGTGQIIRTWTATDCAGNSSTASQVITIADAIPPVLTIPANATFSCGNVPPPTPGSATATDNCSTPVVAYLGENTIGSGCSYQLERTWSATDCSGNTTTLTQIILVNDTVSPVFMSPPGDLTVCSGDLPPLTDLAWSDNCDGSGTVAGTQVSSGTNPEIITRTWSYTDACGNQATHTQTITVSTAVSANAGPDLSICNNEQASLSGTAFGSAGSYLWTSAGDGTFNSPNLLNPVYTPGSADLASGSATLIFAPLVSGGNCDIAPDTLLLTILPLPQANAGDDQLLSCLADSVTLNGSGTAGNAGLSFLWTGPGIPTPGSDIPNPTVGLAGTYILQVADGNCTATDTALVTENFSTPAVEAGPNQMLSCAVASVVLDASSTDFASGVSWFWTGPGIEAANAGQQNPTVNEPGWYVLEVTNMASGCTAKDSAQVEADSSLPLADAGQDQLLSCSSSTATLNGSNSSTGPSIIYQWLGPGSTAISNSLSVDVQLEGAYTLVVTDTSSGCLSTATVQVSIDTIAPLADAGPDLTLTCLQPTATLGATGNPTGPFSYEWFLAGAPAGQEPTLAASAQGGYSLVVTNLINGCTATDTVLVAEDKVAPVANAGPGLVINCAADTVQLQGNASVPNAGFLWSGPGINGGSETLPDPLVSLAGDYVLVVTNPANGCSSAPAFVSVAADFAAPVVQIDFFGELNCVNDIVLLSGSANAQGNLVSYQWLFENNPLAGATAATWQAAAPGIYTLVVTNQGNGCTGSTDAAVVENLTAPVPLIQAPPFINCNQPSALLQETANAGTPGLLYQWSTDGGNFISANLQQSSAEVDQAGWYTLTLTNPLNGCSGSDSIQIQADFQSPGLSLPPSFGIDCQSQAVWLEGTINAAGSVSYQWSGPGFAASEAQVSVEVPGTYTLTVTLLSNGCSASAATEVSVSAGIAAVDYLAYPPDCPGQANGSLEVTTVEGGTAPFSFYLSGVPPDSAAVFQGLAPGAYNLLVVDSLGCSLEQAIVITAPASIDLELGDALSIARGEEVQLSANLSGTEYQFSWSNSGSLSCADCPDPLARPTETTLYVLTVTDSNGCSFSDDVLVNVEVVFGIYVPTAFSPNGDGINDYFTLFSGPQVSRIVSLQVFDRWGGYVYEAENLVPGEVSGAWDGSFRGRVVEAGPYVYVALLEMTDGRREIIKGDILVIY
jgi:gliding motility-associated-like protein